MTGLDFASDKMRRAAAMFCILGMGFVGTTANAQAQALHTPEDIAFPLETAWSSREIQPPWPAFRDSVRQHGPGAGKEVRAEDYRKTSIYHRQGMAEPATYDYGLRPVAANGRVYVGSSSDEALVCLDAASGRRLWTAIASPGDPTRAA